MTCCSRSNGQGEDQRGKRLEEAAAAKSYSEVDGCWVVPTVCEECGRTFLEEYAESEYKIMECLSPVCIKCDDAASVSALLNVLMWGQYG